MKSHVTSLALSKKLRELGVPQESHFWWGYQIGNGEFGNKDKTWKLLDSADIGNSKDAVSRGMEPWYHDITSAFLSSELGWILRGFELPYFNHGVGWQLKQLEEEYHRANNESDARALLLIHLLKNNLITL